MNIDLDQAMGVLASAGITGKDTGQTIGDISSNNDRTPQQFYDMIKFAAISQASGEGIFPENPSPGFGKKTIKDICQMYNLNLADVLVKLGEKGFSAQGDDTVKEVSHNNDSSPMAIFELLKDIAQ